MKHVLDLSCSLHAADYIIDFEDKKQGLKIRYRLINWLEKHWLVSDLVSLAVSTFLQSDHSYPFSLVRSVETVRVKGNDKKRREAKA